MSYLFGVNLNFIINLLKVVLSYIVDNFKYALIKPGIGDTTYLYFND